MADFKGRGKGRTSGQPNNSFKGGAGAGGGRAGGQPRVEGQGGAGHGGGRAGGQPRVEATGGPGHGGGRSGAQPNLEISGGAGRGGGRAGGQPTQGAKVDFGGESRRFTTGTVAGNGQDRAGSSIKAASGEQNPRVADPEGAFIFALEIEGIEVAQFKECSGIKTITAVYEIEEGGQNHRVHKLPGQSRWENLTLRYGVTSDSSLLSWRAEILQDEFAKRRNGSIVMKTLAMDEVRRYNFVQAWPVSWEGPSFSADSAALAIESLELAHHGIQVT